MDWYVKLYEGSSFSAMYARYRPSMSSNLLSKIMEFLIGDVAADSKNKIFGQAIDVGCGTGQSTRAFAPYFSNITGIDVSSSQVEAAQQTETFNHISYRVGTAEELPFPAKSVDLINATQAVHWFDFSKFFAEVNRVLKPGGVLSINTYGVVPRLYCLSDCSKSAKLTETMQNIRVKTLKDYWAKDRDKLDQFYNELVIPYETRCAFRDDCELSVKFGDEDIVTIATVVSYISSLTSYQNYLKRTSDTGLLQRIQNELLSIIGEEDPDEARVKVAFPVTLIMGKK